MLRRKPLTTLSAVQRQTRGTEPAVVVASDPVGGRQLPIPGLVIAPVVSAPAESRPAGPVGMSVLRRRATTSIKSRIGSGMTDRTPATQMVDNATIRRKVDGKVKIKSPEGDAVMTFGDWMFSLIAGLAEEQYWAFNVEGVMGYVWPMEQQVTGKDKDYFRHKEHLHLINKGDEVIVVFTYVHAEVVDPMARKDKQEEQKKSGKTKQHAGGNSDENQYHLSVRAIPDEIPGVPEWMCPVAQQIQALPWQQDDFRKNKEFEDWKEQYKPQ